MADDLSRMQRLLQELVEAFSAVLNFEIEIFDRYNRIAGTGPARDRIGEPLPSCGVMTQPTSGHREGEFVIPPSAHVFGSLCATCCPYRTEGFCQRSGICATLSYHDSVLGFLSIFSENKERAALLLQERSAMACLVEQLARIVMLVVWEQHNRRKLLHESQIVTAVLNMCEKGVIVLDHKKRIVDMNMYLLDRLKLKPENVIGQDIKLILPTFDPRPSEKKHLFQELRHTVGNSEIYLLCMVKPLSDEEMDDWLICIMEDCHNAERLTQAVRMRRNSVQLSDIITGNKAFIAFKDKVKNIAVNDSTVLLIGETGTGKELFARALHEESPRRGQAFVAINCGSIPENLFESELFGYEKGAFTGANATGKPGKFFLANNGTLFLDELEVLPPSLQPKLLRAIERGEIERIGGGQPVPVNVRIVAASNLRLEDMVKRGEFRADLYYRLNVVTLPIPALRERGDDVIVLASHFIKEFSEKFFKKIIGLSRESTNVFLQYRWPGNVRELQNAIEYAINMESSQHVTLESLPQQLRGGGEQIYPVRIDEKERIYEALNRFGWTEEGKIMAARELGISRSTIYRKIRSYGLKGTEERVSL